jgi:signal transduction histidine kinase
LDPSRNQLQVTFVGFNNEPGESLRYRYKLDGTDKAWHDTSEHTVNYAALEPGGYSFLVKALNSGDQASAVPAEIDFVVLPPLWGRWWFEALALAALASLVWATHRYRVAQAVNLERMRIRIATDLHDDIGASLSQIAILSEVLIQRSGEDQGLSGPLSGMARSAREVLASMSDIVWAINPRHDHLRDLQQRMRRFASDLFAARNIDFVFRAPAVDRDLKLGADMRREIFLVFKEAVNNIVRHADCTQAEIDFSHERDWLALRVSDNGKGLPGRIRRRSRPLEYAGQGQGAGRRGEHHFRGGPRHDDRSAGSAGAPARIPLADPIQMNGDKRVTGRGLRLLDKLGGT